MARNTIYSGFLVHMALLGAALIYGASYTLTKDIMPRYVQPQGMILMRVTGALILLTIWKLLFLRGEKFRQRKDIWRFIACAFFGVGLNMEMFFAGLKLTSPVNASLIMVITPMVVLVLAIFLGAERWSWNKIVGISLGAIGTSLLILSSSSTGAQAGNALGDLFIVINAASYGAYLVLVRPLLKHYSPMFISFYTFVIGLVFVLPFGIGQVQAAHFSEMNSYHWFAFWFIIIATTFLTYTLNAFALRQVKSSVVGSYVYLQPLLAIAIATLIGKYELHWWQVLFGLIIMAGVYITSLNIKPTSADAAQDSAEDTQQPIPEANTEAHG